MNYMTEIEEDMWELFFKQTLIVFQLIRRVLTCGHNGLVYMKTNFSRKYQNNLSRFRQQYDIKSHIDTGLLDIAF